MKTYKTLVEISFAARKYNAGETVEMPPERAKKYLDKNQIELLEVAKPSTKQEAST